jgi:tRNA threonylcarbamoyladenosine biosynthesis protein TsaB
VILLAIETSTETCSAALAMGDAIMERYELAPQRHAALILPMIDALLADAGLRVRDLEGLAFGRGPGAFTGVRIAASVIQGLALATGLLVAPISTLAALAQGAYQQTSRTRVLTALDARMGEVYWAGYALDADGHMREVLTETVCEPASVVIPSAGSTWYGTGNGWAACREELAARCAGMELTIERDAQFPRAGAIASLALTTFARGAAVTFERALPHYVRNRVAEPKR